MNSFENSIQYAIQFNNAIADRILEICEEKLFQHFNDAKISSFGYVKIFNDGKWFCVSHNKQWVEYFFNQAFINESFQKSIFDEINNSSRYLLYFNKEEELKIPMYAAAYKFNMWQGFNIYKREENYVEYCWFHGNRNSPNLDNFYINHINELEHFFLYFKSEAADIIDTSDQRKLAILKESIITTEDKSPELDLDNKTFFDKTPIRKFFIKGGSHPLWLTKQEAECAHYLTLGNSLKEVAKLMKISPRTVESYINKIRNKTNCHNKSELINFFRNSDIAWLKLPINPMVSVG